ncbi:MAG: glycosyl hydrolase family 28 protein [Clostridium sp.]|nr:glycosyl hydrolase family 28 protein [Clostridium sp.]
MNKIKLVIAAVLVVIISFGVWFYFSKQHIKEMNNTKLLTSKKLIVPSQGCDDNSITLAWHKPDNYNKIVSYNIYMDRKLIGNTTDNNALQGRFLVDKFYSDSTNKSAVKISAHSYIVKGLKADTSYNFFVEGVDANGKNISKSNTVSKSTTKIPEVIDVTKYGALGNGTSIDTKAIQAAVDACPKGGEVLLPKGKVFKSGAIWLKSDMIFKVDGELLGSENPKDYIERSHITKSSSKNSALINAIGKKESKNLKIIGSGIINGNGWKNTTTDKETGFSNFVKGTVKTVTEDGILSANQFNLAKKNGLSDAKAYVARSNLIAISKIDNVYFGDGLSLENPSQQTIGISSCKNVVLNNILVKTFDCNNGDGIDFDSKGLTVLNSVFDTGDDDINFTAGKGAKAEKTRKPVSDVWIFDNYFRHGHGAVVAGGNTAAWIEDILAEDNVLEGTGSGLRCKTAKGTGGGAKNIIFRDSALKDITDGDGEPFIFTSAYSNVNAAESYKPASDLPQFKNIYVFNCSVDGSKNNAVFVSGLKGAYDENINFENVIFKGTKPAQIRYMKDSTFKNVTFDKSIKNPWNIKDSKNVKIENK